jgi:hypothetical protein
MKESSRGYRCSAGTGALFCGGYGFPEDMVANDQIQKISHQSLQTIHSHGMPAGMFKFKFRDVTTIMQEELKRTYLKVFEHKTRPLSYPQQIWRSAPEKGGVSAAFTTSEEVQVLDLSEIHLTTWILLARLLFESWPLTLTLGRRIHHTKFLESES